MLHFKQTEKNSVSKNASKFDHINLTNIKLYLNSECYPYDNLHLNYSKDQFSLLYEMYASFQISYYYKDNESLFSMTQFKEISPIAVIDCSRQSEILNKGSVDIRLEYDVDVPDNTTAYCVLLHDRILRYNPLISLIRFI